jgi:hypothetical protein
MNDRRLLFYIPLPSTGSRQTFRQYWLRPRWFLVQNSVITDVQNAGLTFVTGADLRHTLPRAAGGRISALKERMSEHASSDHATSKFVKHRMLEIPQKDLSVRTEINRRRELSKES